MQIDKEVLALMNEEFLDFDLQSEAKASWQFADFWQKISDILKCPYHTFDCDKYGQVSAQLGNIHIEIDPETKGTLNKPWFKYSTYTNTNIAGPFRDNFPEDPEDAAKMIVKDLGISARELDMDPNESKNEATLADVEVGDVVRFDGKDGYEYPGKVVRIDNNSTYPIRVEVTGFQKSITPEEVIKVTKPDSKFTESKNEDIMQVYDAIGNALAVGDTVAHITGGDGYSKLRIERGTITAFKNGKVQINKGGLSSVQSNKLVKTV